MYRKKSKQNWEVGSFVNVGFISRLEVMKKIPTPGDYKPDQYLLKRQTGCVVVSWYLFTPHNGLLGIGAGEAAEILEASVAA